MPSTRSRAAKEGRRVGVNVGGRLRRVLVREEQVSDGHFTYGLFPDFANKPPDGLPGLDAPPGRL